MDAILNVPQTLFRSKQGLPTKVILSYATDYVIIFALVFGFYALDAVEPFHQHFSLRNYSIQYPFAVKERITINSAVALDTAVPAIIIAVYTLLVDGLFSHQPQKSTRKFLNKQYTIKERLWELNCGLLGLALSQGLAFVITGALKNATGKPRPDLIARCRPVAGSIDPPVFGLSNSTICRPESHAILKDGFRSFPSGHSSSAFAGLFFLSLYLAGKLHVLDQRGQVWKSFVVMIPTLGAALIAVSRIMDARHHPFDVISGSLLGIAMAYVSYRQYFPPVSESWRKGRAYPIRSWGSGPKRPRPGEREISRDRGVEPLRTNTFHVDEEQPNSTSQAPRIPLRQTSYAEPEGNVFRQQISKSQRLRQAEFNHRPAISASSTELEFHNRVPSFSRIKSTRGRQRNSGGDWSSSSSDHGMNEDEFEMQPIHGLSTSPQTDSDLHPALRPRNKDFEQDTRYHSPARGPKSASIPTQAIAREGDKSLPTSLEDAAVLPTEDQDQKPENPKGVELVESYQ